MHEPRRAWLHEPRIHTTRPTIEALRAWGVQGKRGLQTDGLSQCLLGLRCLLHEFTYSAEQCSAEYVLGLLGCQEFNLS